MFPIRYSNAVWKHVSIYVGPRKYNAFVNMVALTKYLYVFKSVKSVRVNGFLCNVDIVIPKKDRMKKLCQNQVMIILLTYIINIK